MELPKKFIKSIEYFSKLPGIGNKKLNELNKHFKTYNKMKKASKSDFMQVKGITEYLADQLVKFFAKD